MKYTTKQQVDDLIARYPALSVCRQDMLGALGALCRTYAKGGKLLICGNGGSAADAEHIVGELMKGFLKKRPIPDDFREKLRGLSPETADYLADHLQGTLAAVSLVSETALTTAFANDQAPDLAMAQQVLGLGRPEDTLLGISTSGNSANVIHAVTTARAMGLETIALTGETGGRLKGCADITICVPSRETYRIQEYHLPIYHMLCIALEEEFFEA